MYDFHISFTGLFWKRDLSYFRIFQVDISPLVKCTSRVYLENSEIWKVSFSKESCKRDVKIIPYCTSRVYLENSEIFPDSRLAQCPVAWIICMISLVKCGFFIISEMYYMSWLVKYLTAKHVLWVDFWNVNSLSWKKHIMWVDLWNMWQWNVLYELTCEIFDSEMYYVSWSVKYEFSIIYQKYIAWVDLRNSWQWNILYELTFEIWILYHGRNMFYEFTCEIFDSDIYYMSWLVKYLTKKFHIRNTLHDLTGELDDNKICYMSWIVKYEFSIIEEICFMRSLVKYSTVKYIIWVDFWNVIPEIYYMTWLVTRGGGLGSRPKNMYGETLGDGVEYHLMKPTPRR